MGGPARGGIGDRSTGVAGHRYRGIMRLHVIQGRESGEEVGSRPSGQVIRPLEGEEETPYASICGRNLLPGSPGESLDWLLESVIEGCPRVVAWSGSMASGLFDRDPLSWMPRPREAFRALCDGLAPVLIERGVKTLWRPHARHVLADPQTCLSYLRDREGEPFGLAFEPASLFEPEMLPMAESHLERAFESLGPVCDLAILTNTRIADHPESPESTPLHEGDLDGSLIAKLAREHLPEETPIALLERELDAQRAVLRGDAADLAGEGGDD